MTGGCRWHINLVQAVFVILSFISVLAHLLFFLHALFSERKFLRIGLSFVVFILPNTAALSGLL